MNPASFMLGWLILACMLIVLPYLLCWALPMRAKTFKGEDWAPWFTEHRILKITTPLLVLGWTMYIVTILFTGDAHCSFELNATISHTPNATTTVTEHSYGYFCAAPVDTPGRNMFLMYQYVFRFHIFYLFLYGLIVLILSLSKQARRWMGIKG